MDKRIIRIFIKKDYKFIYFPEYINLKVLLSLVRINYRTIKYE